MATNEEIGRRLVDNATIIRAAALTGGVEANRNRILAAALRIHQMGMHMIHSHEYAIQPTTVEELAKQDPREPFGNEQGE